MDNRLRLLLVPVLLSLVGCGGVLHISSIPSRTPTSKVDRVLVELGTSPSGSGELMMALNTDLVGRMQSRGVQATGWVRNYLDIREESKLKAEFERFKPLYILRVRQTSTVTTNGAESGTTLDLLLEDLASSEPIWKARLTLQGAWGLKAAPMGEKIIAALAEDGFLPASTQRN